MTELFFGVNSYLLINKIITNFFYLPICNFGFILSFKSDMDCIIVFLNDNKVFSRKFICGLANCFGFVNGLR